MKKTPLLIFGAVLIVALLWRTFFNEGGANLVLIQGTTMGTITYNVKYLGNEKDYKLEIDDLLQSFNQSLSTYIPNSEISQLNNDGVINFKSNYFLPVLKESKRVYEITNGAFDPTVGPLINAWGFGSASKDKLLDSLEVDSLLRLIGYHYVEFDDSKVTIPKGFNLNFSAIAKGYAVDLVGELLEGKGIENYMVEIGGELRCRGNNQEGKSWSIGVEDPTVNLDEKEVLAIVRMNSLSLATSGNYRNYFEENGKLYAHIINPRTGYTSSHNLLSASVFSSNCMTADAFATAFMVVGLEEAKRIIESSNDLEALLVYQSEDGLKSYVSKGIQPFVELNNASN